MAITTITIEDNEVVVTRKSGSYCGVGIDFDIQELAMTDIIKLFIRKIRSCVLK